MPTGSSASSSGLHGTVTANAARALFEYAATRGSDPRRLAARFGLSFEALGAVDARIPIHAARRIWIELPELLDDDDLGLHLAEHIAPMGELLPALLLASASSLGEGIEQGMTLQRALAEGSTWRRDDDGGELVRYVYEFANPDAAAPRHTLEFGIGLMILVSRRVVSPEVAPAALRFRHGPPRDPRAHRALFRCPIEYRCARDEIEMHAAQLRLPVTTANRALFSHLTAYGHAQVRALPEDDSIGSVARRILDAEPGRAWSLEVLARRLGCAPRTLQRRLRAEGTSLQSLLDASRYQRACAMLRDPAVSLSDVARTLGYSEQAAFHRAFVRWSGVTPGQWRSSSSTSLAAPHAPRAE